MAGPWERDPHPAVVGQATTLFAVLAARAAATPDRPALVESSAATVTTVTYGQLCESALRTATWSRHVRGVQPGDSVAVWLPNWIESVTLQFSLAAVGAAVVGVNTRYRAHELANLIEIARPRGIVVPADFIGIDFAAVLRAAVESTGAPAPWVAVVRSGELDLAGFDVGGGVCSLPTGTDLGAYGPLDQLGEAESAIAAYFATSGSTGFPKLAGHSNGAIVKHSSAIRQAFDMREDGVFLSVLPLAGVFGFNPTMAMLTTGGTCVLEPTFDTDRTLADMARFGVTHVAGGDDLLGRLMDAWTPDFDLSSLRRGGIADFEGRAGTVVEWAARACGASISGVYGSSEAFALMAIWPLDEPVESRCRPGGRLVSSAVEVRVVDADSGAPNAPGQPGVLQIRGYNVADRFLVRAGTPDPVIDTGGWLDTGDLVIVAGRPDEFEYLCRKGDVMRVRGFLVEPTEIERFLLTHPGVSAAKVVGIRDDAASIMVAFVVLDSTGAVSADELISYCDANLASFKVPALVSILDEFPRVAGPNGAKIAISTLREQAAALLDSRVPEPKGTTT
jgi:acyl-CoA synthetase (AMP-forming)/AMP-acid ligase II